MEIFKYDIGHSAVYFMILIKSNLGKWGEQNNSTHVIYLIVERVRMIFYYIDKKSNGLNF